MIGLSVRVVLPALFFVAYKASHSNASPASVPLDFSTLKHKEHGEVPGSPEFWVKILVSVGLVLAGGVLAG